MTAEEPRTPRWWRALPTWAQALWLWTWLPGVAAHEATHWLVGRAAGARPTVDYGRVACRRLDVDVEAALGGDLHLGVLAAAYIAPSVVGGVLVVGLLSTPADWLGPGVPLAAMYYAIAQVVLYAIPSVADLRGAATAGSAWLTQRLVRDLAEVTH